MMTVEFPTFTIHIDDEGNCVTGSFDGQEIQKAFLVESKDAILLLRPPREFFEQKTGRSAHNLCRVNSAGQRTWSAESPDHPDYFVEASLENNLIANSFSCFRLEIDIETGKELSRVFTK